MTETTKTYQSMLRALLQRDYIKAAGHAYTLQDRLREGSPAPQGVNAQFALDLARFVRWAESYPGHLPPTPTPKVEG